MMKEYEKYSKFPKISEIATASIINCSAIKNPKFWVANPYKLVSNPVLTPVKLIIKPLKGLYKVIQYKNAS